VRFAVAIAMGFGFGVIYMVEAGKRHAWGFDQLLSAGRAALHFLLDHTFISADRYDWLVQARADEAIVFVTLALLLTLLFWPMLSWLMRPAKPRLPAPAEMPGAAAIPEGHGPRSGRHGLVNDVEFRPGRGTRH
jgi:hypothetical protein